MSLLSLAVVGNDFAAGKRPDHPDTLGSGLAPPGLNCQRADTQLLQGSCYSIMTSDLRLCFCSWQLLGLEALGISICVVLV